MLQLLYASAPVGSCSIASEVIVTPEASLYIFVHLPHHHEYIEIRTFLCRNQTNTPWRMLYRCGGKEDASSQQASKPASALGPCYSNRQNSCTYMPVPVYGVKLKHVILAHAIVVSYSIGLHQMAYTKLLQGTIHPYHKDIFTHRQGFSVRRADIFT